MSNGTPEIVIGGTSVPPATRTTIDLPVADLYTHATLTMPVHVIRGRRPGPTVCVSAAIHGDELNGVEIIRRLLRLPAMRNLAGTLIAVPIVNVHGFLRHSRYLPDRRDLNRCFPGSEHGSVAARLAHVFVTEILAQADYAIDLHTGAVHRPNLPQIRANLHDPETRRIAEVFGAPVMIQGSGPRGSLLSVAVRGGIRVLLYEAGEPLRFDEDAIAIGLDGIRRVLHTLDMVDDAPPPVPPPLLMHESTWLRADRGGILELHVGWGDAVEEGQPVWTTTSPLGAERATMESPVDGVVIGGTTIPLVAPGDAVLHVGVPGDRPPWEDDPSDEEDDADDTES